MRATNMYLVKFGKHFVPGPWKTKTGAFAKATPFDFSVGDKYKKIQLNQLPRTSGPFY